MEQNSDMKHFRLIVYSLLLILASCVAAPAQNNPDVPPPPPPIGDPLDSFGKISWEDEQARLDNFAVALMNSPDWIGQIIIHAGRKSCPGEVQARAMRMKKYLVERRGIEWNRVIWMEAEQFEESYAVLWLSPHGKLLPVPSPRSETLAGNDMQVINCKTKKQRRRKR